MCFYRQCGEIIVLQQTSCQFFSRFMLYIGKIAEDEIKIADPENIRHAWISRIERSLWEKRAVVRNEIFQIYNKIH